MKIKYQNSNNIAEIYLPSSKSISNRVLILHALYNNCFVIKNVSESNDTQLLISLIHKIENHTTQDVLELDCQDAGTTFRFLTGYCAQLENIKCRITGTPHLLKRPIVSLINALKELGANIEINNSNELIITGEKLYSNEIYFEEEQTSQFITALCLIAPTLDKGLKMMLPEKAVSESYIQMTLDLMSQFGISCAYTKKEINILSQKNILTKDFFVEPDWSSACFFYCMKMLNPSLNIVLKNCSTHSIQGDSFIIKLASNFGIESMQQENNLLLKYDDNNIHVPLEIDLSSYPDLAIPFIVVCAVKYPSVKLMGLESIQYKECDRLQALKTELKKVGLQMYFQRGIVWFQPSELIINDDVIFFNAYNDHRIVMALSMLSLLGITIEFDDLSCVKKSFPGFWKEVDKVGMYNYV